MKQQLSEPVRTYQAEAREHFGLTERHTFGDVLRNFHAIENPTAEDTRCMIYFVFALIEKVIAQQEY